jgi:vanillate O-demethylase monooxygenase subunit
MPESGRRTSQEDEGVPEMSYKALQINAHKPWPHNAWYQAAWMHEITDAPLARTILNEKIVLYRGKDGKAYALEDRCCHRATPLSLGEVDDGGLRCGYHGMVFGGDGMCVEIPGQDSIPPQAKIRSYPIVERQEIVWIWMGEAEKADESEIIDFPYHDDHENWPHGHARMDIKCNYSLLVDNLMDLTHIPFIHRKTIGSGNTMGQVNADMDITKTDKGVHYIRWMEDIVPPKTYQRGAGWDDDTRVDRWQEFEFVAPCTVLQWTGALEHGRGAKENRNQKGGFSIRIWHTATPETEDSCFYFWTASNGFKPEDEAATKALHDEIQFTFDEDVSFLEQQQACMTSTPDQVMVDIKHDAARRPARQALERMIEAEADGIAVAAE